MVKSDVIVRHVCEDRPERVASKCPWHMERNCFLMFNAENRKRYHCLFCNVSRQWHSYGTSHSCDLSEEMHDLRLLKADFGEEYVLPFAYVFRERSGYAVGVFELREGLFGPDAITRDNLSEVFFSVVVLLCAICRRLGGSVPALKLVSLLYTRTHPVLANVGAANSDKRNRVGNRETFNQRSWNRFLRGKTCADVTKYLKHTRPELFKKRCRVGEKCLLLETTKFDDETHRLICEMKKSKIVDVLNEFVHLVKDERIRVVVRNWIREDKLFTEAQARKAARADNAARAC